MKANKVFQFLFLLFIFSLFVSAQELSLKKLKDNFYAILGGGGNVAFMVTKEGVLVVDSKTSPALGERLLEKIRSVTDKEIKYLIFTHYHGDHIQGAQVLEPSVTFISHVNTRNNIEKITLPRLEEIRTKLLPQQIEQIKKKIEELKVQKSPELEKAEEELRTTERRWKNMENLKIILPEKTVENKTSIFLGEKEIVLLYLGRGHTNGDLIVYFPSEKIIHMGDLVFNNIIPYIDFQGGSSTENWIKILEEVEKMDLEIVIPGHGEIGDKSILRAQSEYLKTLREEVKKFVEQGISLEETVKRAELPKYKNLDGYSQRLSRNVEAVYRELKENK